MNRKRALIYGVVLCVLGLLVYMQFRQWRTFDWNEFRQRSSNLQWGYVLQGVALIYVTYLCRALRWKIFLRPVRKDVPFTSLISPTLIGFTGLAILGRPGELIRPYLIARRSQLSFSSQMAVWAVERIFDVAAFTVLIVSGIFLPTNLRVFAESSTVYSHWLHLVGYLLTALVLGLFVVAMLINYQGPALADWVENRFSHLAKNLGSRIALRVREFASGLHTIHGVAEFLQISALSLLMWWLIALAYADVAHSYGGAMQEMSVSRVLLLMGSSMVGSMLQLPGVGGGSQLATIEAMNRVYDIPRELAVSCGILLWLVTFVAVVPAGLFLAHRERLSLRKLSDESHVAEEAP
jgi:glycosyltransferase 2 family protein